VIGRRRIKIVAAVVFVDPFDEFWKEKRAVEGAEMEKEERRKEGMAVMTGQRTGKRIRHDRVESRRRRRWRCREVPQQKRRKLRSRKRMR
jgi:hypothetical protein